MIEVLVLIIMILISALIAVESRNLFSAEVAFGVVGILLCAVFFALRAPEVAITQLIVELLLLVIMLRASELEEDMTEKESELKDKVKTVLAIVFAAVFGIFLILSLSSIPKFGSPLMTVSKEYLEGALSKVMSANTASFIQFEVRRLDIVAASSVLFAGVIGIACVLRGKGRKGKDERDV